MLSAAGSAAEFSRDGREASHLFFILYRTRGEIEREEEDSAIKEPL